MLSKRFGLFDGMLLAGAPRGEHHDPPLYIAVSVGLEAVGRDARGAGR